MLALPLSKLAVGVKVAMRIRPLPLMAPRVPPVTTRSPVLPFQAKLLPGSSLKLKVMVAVSPTLRADLLLVIARVGAWLSMAIVLALLPAVLVLPRRSDWRTCTWPAA